jgi:hypothetical protein
MVSSERTAAGITAGAAVVTGFFLLTRNVDDNALAWIALAMGLAAIVLLAAASLTNPMGVPWLIGEASVSAVLVRPIGWLAGVMALLVAAMLLLPGLQIEWLTRDNILAVGLVAFLVLAVLGWGPTAARSWPTGIRLSTLTVVGSVVAVALIGVYLYFLIGMREAATADGTDADAWARLVELRSTLEALAFAAAGALLGQTVGKQAATQETAQTVAEVRSAADQGLVRALDALTPSDTMGDTVNVENAQSLEVPSQPTEAIKSARQILANAREQVNSSASGNPTFPEI